MEEKVEGKNNVKENMKENKKNKERARHTFFKRVNYEFVYMQEKKREWYGYKIKKTTSKNRKRNK